MKLYYVNVKCVAKTKTNQFQNVGSHENIHRNYVYYFLFDFFLRIFKQSMNDICMKNGCMNGCMHEKRLALLKVGLLAFSYYEIFKEKLMSSKKMQAVFYYY